MKTEELKAYELISTEELLIGAFKTSASILRHKKSGARIAVLENDDENKVFYIGFRTPPKDSTGVAHILEHSVLCGSEKYPLKDPFVELVKGSLNTFLNAMTYPDKTVYPVASCNDQDFQNLIDVYMDAVLHPNIYKKKAIFQQEGWHYEIGEDGKLSYNGVVYNEMKGAFSSADDIFFREIQQCLYPDTAYGVESGGDPKVIPELTYEAFLEFHKKFYHPCNSYIYLYGNADMTEKLNYLDREYLNAYDKISVDSEIGIQKPFDKPKRIEKNYPVEEKEDEKEKAYLSLNYMVGTNLDPELYLAFQILDRVICSQNGAPLKMALLEAGIGKDIYSIYDEGIKQPSFSIVAKDADESREQEFLEIVDRELRRIVEKGFDKKAILSSLNSKEFRYLEADYGRFPKGLMYGLQAMDSWLHDDSKPFVHIAANETYASLKAKVDTGYFEKLVEEYLLNNTHRVTFVMKPKAGLLQADEEALAKKLEEIRAGLTDEQLNEIRTDNEKLKEFQEHEDTKEELLKLPMLKREDLGKKAAKAYNEERKIGDTPFLYHDVFTNGIGYLSFAFSLKNLPEKYFRHVGALRILLSDIDTANYSYGDLTNEINLYTGGIGIYANIVGNCKDIDQCKNFLILNVKYRPENLSKAMELIKEIMLTSKLDDEKRVLEVIREYKSGCQQEMISAGHAVAKDRALSYENMPAAYYDVLSRMSLYRLMSDYEEKFDEKKGELIETLKEVSRMIFRAENLEVDYTGDRGDIPGLEKEVEKLKAELFNSPVEKGIFVPELKKKNEGFMAPSQVNYVCRAGNFRRAGLDYNGSLRVLKVMMGYEYLWMNVRVKNGAYGCMCGFAVNGESFFVSYRDPQLTKTVDVYNGASEFIRSFEADERTMTKYVIGAIGELDTPQTPSMKGSFSRDLYMSGRTEEDLQKERDEILATTPEKIRELAAYVDAFMKDDCFVVAGNSGKIKENEKLFGKVENLF